MSEVGKEDAPSGDEGELNKCKCDGLWKRIEDRF